MPTDWKCTDKTPGVGGFKQTGLYVLDARKTATLGWLAYFRPPSTMGVFGESGRKAQNLSTSQ